MRSIFGWDLPPGCSMRDIERAIGPDDAGDEEPEPQMCEQCGHMFYSDDAQDHYCIQCAAELDRIYLEAGR